LLLAFGGVLFGTAIRGLAEWISIKCGWQIRWGLLACLALLLAIAAAALIWIIPHVVDQASILSDRLVMAYHDIRRTAESSPLGARLVDASTDLGRRVGDLATQAAGVLASVGGILVAVLFVLIVALYVAGHPRPYVHGITSLIPSSRRDRARDVLRALSSTLRRWLLGRLVSMTAVGVITTLGLWALGIPLPVTLGLIAGVFGFVPNVGPIVSAVPAALLAFTVGPMHVVYVLALYLVVNLADGYGLTPWIQKRAVAVPPALIITGQALAGALWGVLGVMFATPVLACVLVLVRELFVERMYNASATGDTES
jgi:predicted PurR-regulated permease PerM